MEDYFERDGNGEGEGDGKVLTARRLRKGVTPPGQWGGEQSKKFGSATNINLA